MSGKLQGKKLFLLDMDGTLYLDGQRFDGTLPFLERIARSGGKAMYMTNNSSKSAGSYVEKLRRMGIEAKEEDFVTSVQASVALLQKEYRGATVYVCGTNSLKSEVRSAGFTVAEDAKTAPDVLLVGFDTELTFQKLDDCSRLLTRYPDLPYFATNPDWVCPTEYGYVPDCGSVCEMLWRATGRRPRVIGKPQPDMVYMALEKTGYGKEETLVVGDRLYTDIACAKAAGVQGAFVLSGEGRMEDIETMRVEPDFIFEDVGQMAKEI